MASEPEELDRVWDDLQAVVGKGQEEQFQGPLERLKAAAETIGAATSGSWIGYHANVYYQGFRQPEPGDHFSPEWGLMNTNDHDSSSGWAEYAPEAVRSVIFSKAACSDLAGHKSLADKARLVFSEKRDEVLSLLESLPKQKDDSFISRLRDEALAIKVFTAQNFVASMAPSGQLWSRDSTAMTQGVWTPPHVVVLAETFALQQPFNACKELARLAKRAAAHLTRIGRQADRNERTGTNVFIGHGRSNAWRSLKDFVQERLRLPWDEFNRVPVAGVTNISRLSEMLDAAAIAFLVMTAEDEQMDGAMRARENVVHEAGLFQGRLGFTRAILLIEEGCGEFSNINGLGQIRFPKAQIETTFEEIRRVLEREGLIDEPSGQA